MSETAEGTDRTAHWGSCEDDDCGTAMVIYPHNYASKDLPPTDDWDRSPFFTDCPVCGGTFFWGGTDPAWDIIKHYPEPAPATTPENTPQALTKKCDTGPTTQTPQKTM